MQNKGVQKKSKAIPHDSAYGHVTGQARYIDDIKTPSDCLHIAPFYAPHAKGLIKHVCLKKAKSAEGVVDVFLSDSIIGMNECSPSIAGDPILADGEIMFHGQVVGIVAAKSHLQARKAARLVEYEMEYDAKPAVTIQQGSASHDDLLPPVCFEHREIKKAFQQSMRKFSGHMHIGGQEHFYLEGQVALAIPMDDRSLLVYSSTQHPDGIQRIIANMLNVPMSLITCECRRMGGGFGGKESQAAQWACLAALVAYKTGKVAKMRLDRDDDMVMTGKRHDFDIEYQIGYRDDGQIEAIQADFKGRCGCSLDLSQGVLNRTLFHSDNAYFYPAFCLKAHFVRTDTVSNTAFRGFGGPQGVLFAERVMDHIAILNGMDSFDVRIKNFYQSQKDITPYGMQVKDRFGLKMMRMLAKDCEYRKRQRAIQKFNQTSSTMLRGLAITPVKFGISFTLQKLNQAGALVHVFSDGSIHLNHGGTEMGQGLYIKVAQIVANVFSVPTDWVHITPTRTDKVPNASPTAASSGSDMNGMAAYKAATKIKKRMLAFASMLYQSEVHNIVFENGKIYVGQEQISFGELARQAWEARISLSEAAHYATPKIHWDPVHLRGRPFLYFAWGVAASEVKIDRLTGETSVERVDIIHDVGRSLNPAIDIGQIEGAFVQGQGWLTSEELVYNDEGRLLTHAPSTYKIPTCSDAPKQFNVKLWDGNPNREPVIYGSKAVGEPPLMLGCSVFSAITHAIASLRQYRVPKLDAPATPEAILKAISAQIAP
ncbi:MAG: xanthine dehydrogenase molybdopterin binding subunit [Pseudomonadota bacterium]